MKRFYKFYLLAFLLLSDFVIYAQGDEDDNGDLEGGDPVPVNSKLIFLLIFGIALAYVSYRRNKKIA